MGYYDEALEILKLLEKEKAFLKAPSNQISLYNLTGIIYSELDKFNLAEQYLLKTKQVAEKHRIKAEFPTVYNNLGVLYFDAKMYDKATPLFLNAIQIDKALGQLTQLSTDHHNLGLLYHDQGFYGQAKVQFETAIRMKEELRACSKIL